MTALDLTRLKELAQAATPGPWEALPHGGFYPTMHTPQIKAVDGSVIFSPSCDVGTMRNPEIVPGKDLNEANGLFIAAANPAAVLELIERLERAEAMLLPGLVEIRGEFSDEDLEAFKREWAKTTGAMPNDPLDDVLPLASFLFTITPEERATPADDSEGGNHD
jgi:hypothetical protein